MRAKLEALKEETLKELAALQAETFASQRAFALAA
jgi:hypothetical protein